MKHLTRRSVTTGALAAVATLPIAGLSKGVKATSNSAAPGQIASIIQRYKASVDALNAACKVREVFDDELNSWCERNSEIIGEIEGLIPADATDALAALDFAIEEMQDFEGPPDEDFIVGPLLEGIRSYIISTDLS